MRFYSSTHVPGTPFRVGASVPVRRPGSLMGRIIAWWLGLSAVIAAVIVGTASGDGAAVLGMAVVLGIFAAAYGWARFTRAENERGRQQQLRELGGDDPQ